MGSVFRSVGAVLLALVVAFGLVVAVELFSAVVHPFPEGEFDMREHVAAHPDWVLAVAAGAWAVTVLVAVWIATRLGTRRHRAHGWVVGLLLLFAVAFNMSMLPYPTWFVLANYLLFPAAIVAGIRLAQSKAAPGAFAGDAPAPH